MSKSQKQRDRLIELLKELFQLNQPDLDFGFYRIMHAKADKVSSFLENDLLKIVSDAFGEADEAKLNDAKLAIEKAITQAKDFGAPDPENAPAVIKAKEAYEQLKDAGNGETEIYDHLYRFFERYYDDGDFLSRRYYARETDGKAAAYSIPYDGREVYLHWANRDQYYIKTSEYLTNFTFNLNNAPELPEIFKGVERKIHCRIIDAAEGEHGNVKTSAANERYFIIDANEPIKFEGNDLIIQFQYRPDSEKTGQGNIWQGKRIDEAEKAILAALEECNQKELLASLQTKIGEKQDRTLLRKYLNQYSSRNTMDYFIHKDLGGFLNRELDFYIKNEIMRLDDIETADAPKVEFFLTKIKILRKIAKSLIEFLAQLEEFQKKIWLKKKFVVETNYCITLDKIPEELYPAIIANVAQHDEWVKLFAINEIKGDLGGGVDYSNPLSPEFLKTNPFLVLDTAFFDEDFKSQVLAKIEDLDEASGGLLIHSENFQGIGFIGNKYEKHVNSIYIDPPYNSSASEIIYKNNYKHSSWVSLMENRYQRSRALMTSDATITTAIDDIEFHRLEACNRQVFGDANHIANIAIMHNPKGRDANFIASAHEYAIIFANDISTAKMNRLKLSDKEVEEKYPKTDQNGRYRELPLRRRGSSPSRADRPFMYFPFIIERASGIISVIPKEEYTKIYYGRKFNDEFVDELKSKYDNQGFDFILPIRDDESLGRWRWGYDNCVEAVTRDVFFVRGREAPTIYAKDYANDTFLPKSLWFDNRYDASTKGTNVLKDILPNNSFDYPKSIFAVQDLISMTSNDYGNVLDFFAGSGTTAHSIISLARESESNRKYVLIEMGDHFDTVIRPRIKKVAYSSSWKDGKPTKFDGLSHIFKYIRLETYEDALNNLHFKTDENREKALAKNDDFRREYMLKYWLEFETKNSPSLLNITQFANPMEYKLSVKKPSSDEYIEKNVDLIETFNWLIGLWVDHIDIPRTFDANFKREIDPELPKDQETRLLVDGKITETQNGKYWFRKIEGKICRTPGDKTNMDKVLVIWRKLSGNLEEDNAVLEAWFEKMRINPNDNEFDIIYINGSCTLPNDKIRIIEEAFHNKMWDVEN